MRRPLAPRAEESLGPCARHSTARQPVKVRPGEVGLLAYRSRYDNVDWYSERYRGNDRQPRVPTADWEACSEEQYLRERSDLSGLPANHLAQVLLLPKLLLHLPDQSSCLAVS